MLHSGAALMRRPVGGRWAWTWWPRGAGPGSQEPNIILPRVWFSMCQAFSDKQTRKQKPSWSQRTSLFLLNWQAKAPRRRWCLKLWRLRSGARLQPGPSGLGGLTQQSAFTISSRCKWSFSEIPFWGTHTTNTSWIPTMGQASATNIFLNILWQKGHIIRGRCFQRRRSVRGREHHLLIKQGSLLITPTFLFPNAYFPKVINSYS